MNLLLLMAILSSETLMCDSRVLPADQSSGALSASRSDSCRVQLEFHASQQLWVGVLEAPDVLTARRKFIADTFGTQCLIYGHALDGVVRSTDKLNGGGIWVLVQRYATEDYHTEGDIKFSVTLTAVAP